MSDTKPIEHMTTEQAIEWLGKASKAIYLACHEDVAKDISQHLVQVRALVRQLTRPADLKSKWECAARKQGSAGGNTPVDCDWPVCGCDPYADKVIEVLEESGMLKPADPTPPQTRDFRDLVDEIAGRWNVETPIGFATDLANAVRDEAARMSPAASGEVVAKTFEDWQEADGNVLWWKSPIDEPPYVGTPIDTDWPFSDYSSDSLWWTRIVIPANRDGFTLRPTDSAQEASGEVVLERHTDDVAVEAFSVAMKQKLAFARAKGRGGWEQCSRNDLWQMLRAHVIKGDVRDIANFCMFIWHVDGKGENPAAGITPSPVIAAGENPAPTLEALGRAAMQLHWKLNAATQSRNDAQARDIGERAVALHRMVAKAAEGE